MTISNATTTPTPDTSNPKPGNADHKNPTVAPAAQPAPVAAPKS
jgi:hypothetical protein